MPKSKEAPLPVLSDSMTNQELSPQLMDQNMKLPIQEPVSDSKANPSSSGQQNLKFVCAICGKTLSKKNVLTRHVRNHSGEKNFRCTVCGKAFFQKSDLGRHSMIHSKPSKTPKRNKCDRVKCPKQYNCELCNEVFSLKRDLSKHMKSHKP